MENKLQDLLHRANALKDSKNYDEIIKNSTQIIELAEKYNTIELAEKDDIKSKTFNNRGNAYRNKGEYGRAIEDYDQAIELAKEDDDKPEVFSNRGVAYRKKGEYSRAIEDYDQAIKLDPKYTKAFYNRGFAYDKKGEYDLAIKDYDQAIELSPRYAKAFNNRGVAYNQKGEYGRAIEDYDQAIELNSKYADAFYNRGVAYDEKSKYDLAIKDYDQAIKLDKKYVEAFNNRGVTYNNKGEYDLAIADFNQAIELNPKLAKAFYNRGVAYKKKGDEAQALKDFKEANKLDPTIIAKEEVKEVGRKAKNAEDFQTTLKQLKDEYKKVEKPWLWASAGIIVVTAMVVAIGLIFSKETTNVYPISLFLSAITFIVIHQYTNAKQLTIEAENRLAMAKMFEKIRQEKDSDYKKFLPKIVDAIVYSTRKSQSSGELSPIFELIKKLPLKK